ncbi:MAG: chitobiase/beta-hexosaminidase C-terminal domain-containing protein [Lachnospiraceae bacterium]|nr:chitobiase/beta-hexosaminidase C-terminal domain-containing protein [Lachnospiraceae bacterium]
MKKMKLILAALLCTAGAAVWGAKAGAAETYERLEGAKVLWDTPQTENGTTIYYRIPSFATANDGRLIAVTDKRYGHAGDLGNHKIDILVKTSADNGVTWSQEQNLTQSLTTNTTGFGDAAMVADRESDKVLMLTASGSASFFNSSRQNKLGVHQFISDDGGQTFKEPVNITDTIYGFDESWPSLFVGSGRIMQSRYIKVGTHYRIYCAISTRSTSPSNQHENWVIYSDNFGESWNVLGGVQTAPIAPADEPKVEELPNGDVLIASRKDSGRYINIFHYEDNDDTYTQGSWDTQATLPLGASRGTDGETYILYAKEKATNEYVYLALQSVPTAVSYRRGVGIFYKELSESDTTPQEFVKGWSTENFLMVQSRESAYSTFTLQDDGKLGFFYEEGNPAYDMVYVPISIEQLTGGKYEAAFTGIGSTKKPYQLDTKERVAAYVDVFSGEKVNWGLEGNEQAVNWLKEIFNERKTKANELYEGEQLAKSRDEAVAVNESYEEAVELGENPSNEVMIASCQSLKAAISVYEGLVEQQEVLQNKKQEADALLATERLIARRMETADLKTAINEAQNVIENELATITYERISEVVAALSEKMAVYEAADTENFSVEARYNSNNIRFAALSGVTQYKILRSQTSAGDYTEVGAVDAAEGKLAYSYIDSTAGVGTQYWYDITAVEAADTEGQEAIPDYEPKQDTYPTGIQAVQKHAESGQYHKAFTTGVDARFNGNTIVEAEAEDIARVAGLREGTILISYKPENTTGKKTMFVIKQANASVGDGDLGANTGLAVFQNGAALRIDAAGAMKANWNNEAPAGEWSTFGFVNTAYSGSGNNAIASRNGTTGRGFGGDNLGGFIGKSSNLADMSIGAAMNGETMALPYTGKIAYVTITDEIFSQAELDAYTGAVNAALVAAEPAAPAAVSGFTAAAGNGEVALSWTGLAENVTYYEVSKDDGATWVKVEEGTSYTFTELTNGTPYTFKIRAFHVDVPGPEASAAATPQAQAVATPVFSPAGGTYTETKTVEISTATEGASIYYTTNGTVPTTDSTEYTEAITVNESMTIKAIAVKEGMSNSAVASAAYTINLSADTVETPAFNPAGGTYDQAQRVIITSGTEGASIYYTTDGTAPTAESAEYTGAVTVGESMTIRAIAVKEGMGNSAVAEAAYVIRTMSSETAATPVFSVKAGTYTEAITVEISTSTEGAAIYYTTDGSTPTVGSTRYAKAVTVDRTMTIKAIAVKEGMKNSRVAAAAYTIKESAPVQKPWIFTDVNETAGNWKYESVKYVYNNEIMGAISGTREFQPDRPLSRSMFATVLYRMAGEPEVAFEDKFTDVPAGKWYSNAIIWAYKNKIVAGYMNGSFGIDDNITREQIAKMLFEYAKVSKYDISERNDLGSFTDKASVSGWAVEYMQWATAVKMITGKPNDDQKTYRMDPQGAATRAECAAMLTRFAEKYDK